MRRASRRKNDDSVTENRPITPLLRLLAAGQITRIALAARSGVNLRAIKTLADDGEGVFRLPISTLFRVSIALGCAPVELLPSLGRRSSRGLLWDRGIFRRERTRRYTP